MEMRDRWETVELPASVGTLFRAAVTLVTTLRAVQDAALLVSMQARDAGVDLDALPALRAALEAAPVAAHEAFLAAQEDVRLPAPSADAR